MSLIHSSYYQPKTYAFNGSVAPANIDRAQSIDPSGSTNWEKVEESPDVFGLRAKYQETGEFPERFLKDITRPIHDLFAEHGYGLPWMRT